MEINDVMLASALMKIKGREISAIPDSSEISKTFSAEFESKMNKLIDSLGEQKRTFPIFKNTLAKAAAVFFALCIAAFSVAMASPRARAAVENAIMEIYESYIKFFFMSGEETPNDFRSYEKITAEYIPDGFTLKAKYNEYEAVGYRYENDEGMAYDIYISLNDGLSVHTAKEEQDVEKVLISGREAYLVSGENEGSAYSTLIVTGNKITVTIYGRLNKDEIIEVGKSLKEVRHP